MVATRNTSIEPIVEPLVENWVNNHIDAQLTRFREKVIATIQNAIVVALSGPVGDAMRRNDEGTSRGTQPQFTRMTKIEFPKFGGDDVRGWLYKCEQFFEIDHVLDPHKVQPASINLYDTASLWHRQFVKLMGESASWNSFKEAIMKRFCSPYDDPMGDINNLRLAGSIEEYQNAFDRLQSRIDLPEDQQVSCYIAGLQNDVEMAVRMFRPKTLAEVYHLLKVQEAAIKVNKQKYRSQLLPTPRGQVFNMEVVADPVHDYPNDSVIDHGEEVVHEEVTEEGRKVALRGTRKSCLRWMEGSKDLAQPAQLSSMVLYVYPSTALNMVSANLTEGF
nr:hypothetical protein [Tanacetum cinerariifolium]